jgi:HEPN domain-containing protein
MKKITKDWLTSAESDLLLIGKIISQENLTHLSAFHAQQAIEKSFKAIIEEFDLGFIKTHSLEMLYSRIIDKISIDVNVNLLILLDQLYIDARYPGEMGLLPNGNPTVFEAQEFYDLVVLIINAVKAACK